MKGFNENAPLVQRLVEHVRNQIMEGTLAPGSQLPNELMLADQFNVSRSTMRAALQALERAGFVLRKRGKGTFIADEPLKRNNLSLNWGVTQVIRSIGAVPGTKELEMSIVPADEKMAKNLNVDPGSEILVIERVRTADLRCVVYTIDYIPRRIFSALFTENTLEQIRKFLIEQQSIYQLFEMYLPDNVHHAIAHISPLTADDKVAQKLQISQGSGILYIEQIDYDSDGDPIWVAHEYHVANAFTFSIYRSM